MTTYAVISTVRGRANRTQRAGAPAHHRLKQHVGASQARLVRGRPLIISEEIFQRDLEDLRHKNAQGILEVRTMDGRLFDLSTLQAAVLVPQPPLPHPPLDSIANDLQVGIPMGTQPGGKGPNTLPEYTPEEDAPFIDETPLEIPPEFLVDDTSEDVPMDNTPKELAKVPNAKKGGTRR